MKVGDRVALRLGYNRLEYWRRGIIRSVGLRYDGEQIADVTMENGVIRSHYTRNLILADEVHLEVRA